MGLVLKPSELKNAAQQMRAGITGNRSGYNNALRIIQRFAENEDLNSQAWDTAKFKMGTAHQLIMQGMQAVQEAIERDLDTLETSIGEEDLDEDELITDIERLTNECIWYEEAIRNLQRMSGRSILNGYSGIQTAIGNYKALLEHTRAELEIKKKTGISEGNFSDNSPTPKLGRTTFAGNRKCN